MVPCVEVITAPPCPPHLCSSAGRWGAVAVALLRVVVLPHMLLVAHEKSPLDEDFVQHNAIARGFNFLA